MSNDYFKKMAPYAKKAQSQTKINSAVILAQWYLETGGGTSDVSKNANNHAGIKSNSAGRDGVYKQYAKYNSLNSFATDYSRVMGLSYYTAVREAKGIENQVKALDKSPWAEDPLYGQKLLRVIETNGLGSVTGGIGVDMSLDGLMAGSGAILEFFKTPWLLGLIALFVIFKK